VDLIAPNEIAMPDHYVAQMRQNGFQVRSFGSIQEYLAQDHQAPVWYFTRLQLERMGEKLLKQSEQLRNTVTFSKEFLPRIDPATRFFHPLPRHSETPTIPTFLDDTPFNSWDEQSRNGYFTRIIEIGMLGGLFGSDFIGKGLEREEIDEPFIEEAPIRSKDKPEYKIGIRPVDEGIVIDHIGTGSQTKEIWDHINKIRNVLDLHQVSSQGVFQNVRQNHYKGIISVPGLLSLDDKQIKMLAAIAPDCTLNIVSDHRVKRKYRLRLPARVSKLPGVRCRNTDCISNPDFYEPVIQEFRRLAKGTFVCQYCNTPHEYQDIWAD
jgi:aspartate carbamoyltransferase